jgi:hypothetical protein
MKTSVFAGGVDSLHVAEQESNDDITEGEKDPSTSTRTRQVNFVEKNNIKKIMEGQCGRGKSVETKNSCKIYWISTNPAK